MLHVPVGNLPLSGSERCTGLKLNFFTQEPAGDLGEKFGRQIINFGRQLIGQYRTIPENPSTIVKYLLKM